MNVPLRAAVAVSGIGLVGGMAFGANAVLPTVAGAAHGTPHHAVAVQTIVHDDDFGPGSFGTPGGVGGL